MAVGWFICGYKRRAVLGNWPKYRRYCAMDDFTTQIRADGGDWSESEVLGNCAVVKVRASESTLATIAAAPGIVRLPLARLTDALSTLTNAQRTAINTRLLDMGYTQAEIDAALGQLRQRTLGDVLRFAATRRRKPRYDPGTDSLVFDGTVLSCRPIADVDATVGEG